MPRISLMPRFVLLALAAALLVLVTASVAAANVGGFEGADGDQASACGASIDWACLSTPAGLYDGVSDNVAPNDDVFVSSSKEDAPDQWMLTTGSASSAKSDIQAAWSAGASTSDAHVLELAFKVAGSGSNTFVGFELNQNRQSYSNAKGASVVCRRTGDLLISYGIGGGTPPNLTPSVSRWVVDAGGPAACPGSNGHFVDAGLGSVELGLNNSTIVNTLPVDRFPAGSTFGVGTFGEAAVDLDALAPDNGCTYFNRLQVTSRTSASTSSTLDDVLPATRLVAAACHQVPADGGGTTTAPAISADPAASCSASGGVVAFAGTGDAAHSDLEIREVSGDATHPSYTTRVTNVQVAADGTWSASLSPVADGTHRYVADYATVSGTVSPERTTVVSCGGSGGGADSGANAVEGASGSTAGAGGATIQGSGSVTQVVAGATAHCVYKTFRVSIVRATGRLVRFTVDGHVVATVRPGRHHRFSIVIDPLKFARGAHTVRARVLFTGHRKAQTVTLRRFVSCSSRCAKRRGFTIRVPKVRGTTVIRAVVTVSGKHRLVIRGRQLTKPVHLTHLPKSR
ncbi:MAG: hypothetical protein QOF12_187, partial [Solirubrobacteraceae bacterium]|nr:hypothetical protein [Solirubrobacteraceae bacterium]